MANELTKITWSIWFYSAQHLGFFFCIIVVLCKYLLTSSLHHPQCQKQWPISVHSSIPASCSIHHSSPFYWLLPLSSIKASSTNHTNKNNISSTLKFLWLLNSLTFPSRQTTGKHHLKALFFSFLLPSTLNTLTLHWLLSLHQRVVNNLCQWFLDGKKMADILQCTFFFYKSVALEISPMAWNFMCKLSRLLLHVTPASRFSLMRC